MASREDTYRTRRYRNISTALKRESANLDTTVRPTFQGFQSGNGTRLESLPTLVCSETAKRYILWTAIQDAFVDIDHLQQGSINLVLFAVDRYGEL